jgi:exopolyphosphatase/guanosine-5'-triphosphate,3'-diphosphate pyrophosphatase
MRMLEWPVDDPHGFQLPAEEALRLARLFEKGGLDDPDPRISAARLATLPDAAALLIQLIEGLRPPHLVFSSWGLREGLLHLRLPEPIRKECPMLASVADFALGSRVAVDDAVRVARWTAPVAGTEDEELRQASTLLALSAMRTEPNLRTEEALTWALRKRWIGIDMRGRGMMAMTVFANSGLTEIPPQFLRLADEADLDRAIGWGLAVRLCRRLTGSTPAGLGSTALAVCNGTLVLSLDEPAQPLFSASIGKDLKALAEWLGLEWTVEAKGGSLTES